MATCKTISCLVLSVLPYTNCFTQPQSSNRFIKQYKTQQSIKLQGWIQDTTGEWTWEEDDATFQPPSVTTSTIASSTIAAVATPTLPSGKFRPKQSLGQNYLRDGNTVAKIVRAFVRDATETAEKYKNNNVHEGSIDGSEEKAPLQAIELGPGAGALTDVLIPTLGVNNLQVIEIDGRSVELLSNKHPELVIHHQDVLQVDYPKLAREAFNGNYNNNKHDNDNDQDGETNEPLAEVKEVQPLSIIGNLPYYITSQILFALADASHTNSIKSATVTMQYEVGLRLVAPTKCKDYGILSVVFQLYAECKLHFKIPPTVFYPKPKVDSVLVGLHFVGPDRLRRRLVGVRPEQLRSVVNAVFQKRRKTVLNGLKVLALSVLGSEEKVKEFFEREPLPLPDVVMEDREKGDEFALAQELPLDWTTKRPEELSPGQFIEITRLLFGAEEDWEGCELRGKVWRKMNHGVN